MFFTQAGPAHWLEQILRSRIARARELGDNGDRGASAVEWVVITAALVVIVGAVALIIYNKLQSAANSITPNPGIGGGGGGGKP